MASDQRSSPCDAVSLVRAGVSILIGVEGLSGASHRGVSSLSSISRSEAFTVRSESSRRCCLVRGRVRLRSMSDLGGE